MWAPLYLGPVESAGNALLMCVTSHLRLGVALGRIHMTSLASSTLAGIDIN